MTISTRLSFIAVQVTIGPWIENGFYYDFYRDDGEAIADGDLKKSAQAEWNALGSCDASFERTTAPTPRTSSTTGVVSVVDAG